MSEMHGMVWWTELMTRDVAAARSYYEDVCGWTFDTAAMPEGDYHIGSRDGVQTIGIMDMTPMPHLEGVPAHWFTYFAVDDVDAAIEQSKAKGATVTREPFDVQGIGRIAIVVDPTGAVMGLMTPSVPASG